MAETTARLALPLLQAGQAQKELYHNEALALIDISVAAGVEAVGQNAPPASPLPGQCWVVGAGPTGDWAGQAGAIAGWTAGGWRFVVPHAGTSVWSAADQLYARFDGAAWVTGELVAARVMVDGVQVIGAQAGAIDAPAGGTVVDAEARETLASILAMLRSHGLIAG